jgi:hypothetical protein
MPEAVKAIILSVSVKLDTIAIGTDIRRKYNAFDFVCLILSNDSKYLVAIGLEINFAFY